MNVLLTGASGFIGRHIMAEACARGISVTGLGRSAGNAVQCDLSRGSPALDTSYSKVIHGAGLAHIVDPTDEQACLYEQVNVTGLHNLLSALKAAPPDHFVLLSSVAVYGRQSGTLLDENTPCAATDPYGASKLAAENLVSSWCRENTVALTILRLPLVVGHNAPGNLQSLLSAVRRRRFLLVGGGSARRSMVLATDVARFVFELDPIDALLHLTDGQHPSYRELCEVISAHYSQPLPLSVPAAPMRAAAEMCRLAGKITDKRFRYSIEVHQKLTRSLTFHDQRARNMGWVCRSVLQESATWLPK